MRFETQKKSNFSRKISCFTNTTRICVDKNQSRKNTQKQSRVENVERNDNIKLSFISTRVYYSQNEFLREKETRKNK